MTRIIGGQAGSLRLVTPGAATRPTSDRVREAWFSRIEAHRSLAGATVLDLYAGSGALGLEAASRGARSVTLVDNHRGAIQALHANITTLRPVLAHQPDLLVVNQTVQKFLQGPVGDGADCVFIDPPYDLSSSSVNAILSALLPKLAPGAWVMVERSTRSEPLVWPEGMNPLETKKYGETTLYFAEMS